ncbi:MAG TPA: dipeptidase [Firmicutes bacterium]|nr:dipeptidase [Candidatus Fermentithermobacillaceae bacterium]
MPHAPYIEEFLEFLSIPSVSASPEHKLDIERAAQWLKARMERAGIQDAEVIPTAGHPVVYGLAAAAESGAPTVLIYGHYDTQPEDPLDEWVTEPFKPEVRDGKVFARGAADNKGGVLPAIVAIEKALARGGLPVNVKFLFEGEEEIGSPNLKPLLAAKKDLFKCDLVVSVDGGMYSREVPSLTTGSRGLCGIQIDVYGPKQDLHSGSAGGAVNNPLIALAQLIATMKDGEGKVLVEGFYDDVAALTQSEREAFAKTPFDEREYMERAGVKELFGEPGFSVTERLWARPTLDVVGIWGGFQGEGVKTIIPARASCKITCRLVPHQEPDKVVALLKEHVERHAPRGVRVSVTAFPGNSRPYVIPFDHPVMPVMSKVLKDLYGKEPVIVRMGGTLPIARAFLDILGTYLVFFATSSPDENVHGPNEFYRLEEFDRLVEGLPVLLKELSGVLGR